METCGYQIDFIDGIEVKVPELSLNQMKDLVTTEEFADGLIPYINYSLKISFKRKFSFFTATNIDGKLFRKIKREDGWKKDSRIKEHQYGTELYGAEKSNFDKGHMTKREDVQWGQSEDQARAAAASTFYYSNAIPQHSKLNRRIWKDLEDYVLHTETNPGQMKINLFTGPVLDDKDPYFVTEINGIHVQIPTLFWKVVYFSKRDGMLYCAAFLMSQESLLVDSGIVDSYRSELETHTEEDKLFMQFKEADTYQVNLSTIAKLTKHKFTNAVESYKDDRPIKLILKEINIDEEGYFSPESPEAKLGFRILNINL